MFFSIGLNWVRKFSWIAITMFCTASTLAAAEITILNDNPEGCMLRVTGTIAAGDTELIKETLPGNRYSGRYVGPQVVACLDSPGGSLIEGLKLADFFRTSGVSTHVESGATCLSACAIAFLGGTRLSFEDAVIPNRSRSLHATATLGFHPPQLDVPDRRFNREEVTKAFQVAIRASALLFDSLDKLDISRQFALNFFAVPQGEFYYVDTVSRADELGVDLTGLSTLPQKISDVQLVSLCLMTYSGMSESAINDPDGGAEYLGAAIYSISLLGGREKRQVYLVAYSAEGDTYWKGCVVKYNPIRSGKFVNWITVESTSNSIFVPGIQRNLVPISRAKVEEHIRTDRLTLRRTLHPSMLLEPETPLSAISSGVLETPVRNPSFMPAYCTPTAASYRIGSVQNFSNMRASPGFGSDVLAEVPLNAQVFAVSPGVSGTRILSDQCKAACDHKSRGRIWEEDLMEIGRCLRENQIWWNVRTRSGQNGWMSTKFLFN